MKSVTRKSSIGRTAALGISAALIGGVSLTAGTGAFAAEPDYSYSEPDVYANEISVGESGSGWFQSAGPVTISAAGLVLPATSRVGYAFDDNYDRRVDYNLLSNVESGVISWTTTEGSAPANFEIPFAFGSDATSPQFTTLSSTTAVSGVNTAQRNQIWTTSGAIGTDFDAGESAPLIDLILAIVEQDNEKVLGFGVRASDAGAASVVTGLSWETAAYSFRAGERLTAGTVSLSGTPTVGSLLTVVASGWPDGTAFTYEWYMSTDAMGNGIDNAGATYTVSPGDVGFGIGVIVTGTKPGFGSATVRAERTAMVTAPVKPAAAAPVANSSTLATYLASKGATPQAQTTAGLPAGDLNPTTAYTANVEWFAADSFVDVYVYSTPTFVGTFPVVNGAAQVTLSAELLSKLAAGSHTLVVTGQSSGEVQGLALSVAATLAATGFDVTVPLTGAALLLLLGGAMVFTRNRRRAHA
jgi:hypothetical protein